MTNSRKLLSVVLVMLLSGCAGATSEPASIVGKPCPPLVEYSKLEQRTAAGEIDYLKRTQMPPCVLCQMMDDYSLMRDQCRGGV